MPSPFPGMADVMAYIEEHRDEVEAEYQTVLRTADENRQSWAERNREQLAVAEASPDTPERTALRARLQDWKARLDLPD